MWYRISKLIKKNTFKKCFYLHITMKTFEYVIYIANALKYIHWLSTNEQINELNALLKR